MGAVTYDDWKANAPDTGSAGRGGPAPRPTAPPRPYRAPNTCKRCDGRGFYFTGADGARRHVQTHEYDRFEGTCPDCRGLGRHVDARGRDLDAKQSARHPLTITATATTTTRDEPT